MRPIRASSLPLLMKCAGSLTLPASAAGKSEKAEKAAAWGTMVHRWKETGEYVGPKRAARSLEKAVQASGIDRLSLWPANGTHEGSISLSLDGSRQASRDDTERPGWLTGHYDFTWWLLDGELWIDDLKTNALYPNPGPEWDWHDPTKEVGENRFPPQVTSPQMSAYALGLSEILSYTGSVSVSLTHWPYLPLWARHSLPTRSWVSYSRGELLSFWGELEAMYRRAQFNELAAIGKHDFMYLEPGAHCRFCPAECLFKT